MSDTKWTPGPWAIAAGYKTMLLVESRFGGPVCDIECHCDADTGILPSEEEEGNAHLIAAAPELAEAVRKAEQLARVASDWNLDEVEIDGDMVPTHQLFDEFTAALAKARGQS